MPEFLTSPMFFAILGGFLMSYLVQVLIMGPRDAAKTKRNEEFVGRLSETERHAIYSALENKNKAEALALLQEHAKIGAAEAKECVHYITRQMRKK